MASLSSSGALSPISDADAAQSARTAAGYAWMMVNCLASAGYVLGMRKRIKVTNFKVRHERLEYVDVYLADFCYYVRLGLGLHVLQQPPVHPSPGRVLASVRGLVSQDT